MAKAPDKQNNESSHPTSQVQGKRERRWSILQPPERAAGHPFSDIFHQWATKRVPVDCGPEWDWQMVEMAVAGGAHHSVLEPESIQLVHEDISYQVKGRVQ
jgi:hypothetical protein